MNIIRNSICCISMTLIFSCNSSPDLVEQINSKASLPAGIHFKGRGLKVMNTLINKKKGTMSTLYGNEIALSSAKAGMLDSVAGLELLLVTWNQQPNKYWYGNNIPGKLLSIEKVSTQVNGKLSYMILKGDKFIYETESLASAKRIDFILHQKPSVLP